MALQQISTHVSSLLHSGAAVMCLCLARALRPRWCIVHHICQNSVNQLVCRAAVYVRM